MKREKIIASLPLKNDARSLEISVYYHKGGMNWFSNNNERRGLYLSVTPICRVTLEGGGTITEFTGFSGIKKCVKELNRFSDKVLSEFVPDPTDIERLKEYVLNENKMELA